jgi:NAD(P)H dehydrogenase (quinone)
VPVRALVRRPEQVALMRTLGAAEVTVGDLRERGDLRRAVHGVGGVYYVSPHLSSQEETTCASLVRVMQEAGAWRLVYHSVLRPQAGDLPHHGMKLRTETCVVDSGLACTILQPAPYMQNLLVQRYDVTTHGVYRVPHSILTPFSWVDLDDVAEAAAMVFAEPGHDGATYELAGPEPLNSADVAERWGCAAGRSVRSETIKHEAWARALGRSDVGGYALEALGAMAMYYDRHGLVGNPNLLTWLLSRPPRTLMDFLTTEMRRPAPARRA